MSLAGELDFETDQNYVIKISAYDVTDQPLSSECVMRVDVIDVNDNVPEFTSSVYEVCTSFSIFQSWKISKVVQYE